MKFILKNVNILYLLSPFDTILDPFCYGGVIFIMVLTPLILGVKIGQNN